MQDRGTDLRAVANKDSNGIARMRWLVRKLARRETNALALPLSLALLGSSIARELDAGDVGTDAGRKTDQDAATADMQAGDTVALMLGDAVLAEHLLSEAEMAAGQVRIALRVFAEPRVPGGLVIEPVPSDASTGSAQVDGLEPGTIGTADAAGFAGGVIEGAAEAQAMAESSAAGTASAADGTSNAVSATEEDDDDGLLWLILGVGAAGAGVVLLSEDGESQSVISGQVVKGYVQGAAVYLDTNHDGLPDGDPVYTDAQGRFTFNTSETGASIVVYGGIDTLTNVPFEGMILRAPPGSTVVTPLTTLMDEMMRQDATLSAAEAQAKLAAALGLTLPAGTDLRTYDPVAGIANGGAAIEDSAEAVLNTLSSVQSLLTGAGVSGSLDAASTAITALAQTMLQSTAVVDLTSTTVIEGVLQTAFAGSGVGASEAADLTTLSGAIAAVNDAIYGASGLGDSALQITRYALSSFQDLLTGIGANARSSSEYSHDISFGSNEALASAIAQLAGGDVSGSVGEHLGASISYAERLEGGRFVFALNPELKFFQGTPDKIDTVTVRFDVEGVLVQRETRGLDGQITTQTLTPNGDGAYTLQYAELDKIFVSAPEHFNGTLGAEVSVHYVGLNITDTPARIGIEITAVNDAPTGQDATASATEDEPYVFQVADFPFTDGTDSSQAGGGNALGAIRIVSLPGVGTLYLGEDEVTEEDLQAGLLVSAAEISDGLLRYVPEQDGFGENYSSFQFQLRDDGGTADGGVDLDATVYTIKVDVTGTSDAPVATGGDVSVGQNGEHVFAASDFGFSDVDGDAISRIHVTSLPENGVLMLNDVALAAPDLLDGVSVSVEKLAQGVLRFVPAAGYIGAAGFGYRVEDDGGAEDAQLSTEGTLDITVVNVSDAPVAGENSGHLSEDGTRVFAADDFGFSDDQGDDDALAAIIVTGLPGNGRLVYDGQQLSGEDLADGGFLVTAQDLADGKLSFVPEADFYGEDSFGYLLRDTGSTDLGGSNTSDPATFILNVSPEDDAPVASGGAVQVTEDEPYAFSAADFGFSDVDGGDALHRIIITSLPEEGSLLFSGHELRGEDLVDGGYVVDVAEIDQLSYVTAGNSNVPAGFSYRLQDDSGAEGADVSEIATMSIAVTAVSDAPVATGGSLEATEDTSRAFSAADFGFSDVDGDALRAIYIRSLPSDGVLKYGDVELTVDDLVGEGFEIDAENIGFLRLIPGENFTGEIAFDYAVRDSGDAGADTSASATLTVSVTGVNDAPEAASNSAGLMEDGTHTFSEEDFDFSDVESDDLAAVIITSLPGEGVLKYDGVALTEGDLIEGGWPIAVNDLSRLVYVPGEDYNGAASFGYQLRDAGGNAAGGSDTSADATFVLNVNAVSDAPDTSGGSVSVDEDETYTFSSSDFSFSDVDGDSLKGIWITSLPENGKLFDGVTEIGGGDVAGSGYWVAVADIGNLSFIGDANYNGPASFGYQVQDNSDADPDLSEAGTMSITVNAVSDAPVATSGSVSTDEDQPYTFSSSDFGYTDVDSDSLSKVLITSLPGSGTLKYDGVALVSDDVDGGGYEILAGNIGLLVFEPAADSSEGQSFGYKVVDSGSDGLNASGGATMNITVNPVSDAPEASGGSVSTDEDVSYTFSSADFPFSDVDSDPLSKVLITSLPGGGTLKYDGVALVSDDVDGGGYEILAGNIGLLVFEPAADSSESQSFGYKVVDSGSDGLNVSNETTMSITVNPVSDAPVATDTTIDIHEDTSHTFSSADFPFTDVDGDSLSGILISSLPQNGTLKYDGTVLTPEEVNPGGYEVLAGNIGLLVFEPATDYHGEASFEFKVVDSGDVDTSESTATVTIKVKSVNDDPELGLPEYSGCETPEPICDAFRVNTGASGSQETPRITALAGGGYVVAWVAKTEGEVTDYDVYAKVYGADGQQVGEEFRVSLDQAGDQLDPAVVARPDGGFAVMWSGWNSETGSPEIFSRTFCIDEEAGIVGAEVEAILNRESAEDTESTDDRQFDPVAVATRDGMAVVWTSDEQDGVGYGVYMRLQLGENEYSDVIRVNSITNFDQFQPSLAALNDGTIVVSWTGLDDGTGSKGIFMRRFGPDGTALDGQDVLVNVPQSEAFEAGDQYQSSVAALADGGYVVTWTGASDSLTEIFAQRYDASGCAVGDRIVVNAGSTADEQRDPAVIGLPTGGFLVTWTSWGNEESSLDVYAQRFGTDGYPLGERILVNSSQETFEQTTPALAVLADGSMVVAWQSNTQDEIDNEEFEIYAQRFELMRPYYIEGAAPVAIAPTATVSDVELGQLAEGEGNWTGATLVIEREENGGHGGFWNWFFQSPDRFAFQASGGYSVDEHGALLKDGALLGRFTQLNGRLTVDFGKYGFLNPDDYAGTATPTTADVNYVLQHVTYWNSSDDPGESVTLQYRMEDGNGHWLGSQGSGGEGQGYATVEVKLIDVNDAPDARNIDLFVSEDQEQVFAVADFRFNDAEEHDLCTVTITSIPDGGTLYFRGEEVTQEDLDCEALEISAEDLECGELRFVPGENFHGTLSFGYFVKDDGGTERGGEDTSDGATLDLNYISVNDAPELDLRGYDMVVTTLEDVCDENDGKLSLREALAMACDGDSITFAKDLLGGTLCLESTLDISRSVYINGASGGDSEDRITLRTDGSYTAIQVAACATDGRGVILSGLSIQGDDCVNTVSGPLGSAAAIVNAGRLTLHDVEISDYHQQSEDPSNPDVVSAIFNEQGATLHADGLELDDNSARGYGDEIDALQGGSAYLIYNQGQMDLADTDIEDSNVEGGDAAPACGTGGDAYLIYNADCATFAGDICFEENCIEAGSGESGGNSGNYYSDDSECPTTDYPPSSFCYEAPNLLSVFTEGQDGAVRIAPNARIADVELDGRNNGAGDWSGASITIGPKGEDGTGDHQGGWWWGWWGWWNPGQGGDESPPEDVIGLEDAGNLSFSFDGQAQGGQSGQIVKTVGDSPSVEYTIGNWAVDSDGQLVISFHTAQGNDGVVPTSEDVNNVLRLVTYRNTSEDPDSQVTLSVTVKDGNGLFFGTQGFGGEGREICEVDVVINPVNDAPVIAEEDPIRTVNEDTAYSFQVADFPFTDAEGHDLGGILITDLPDGGRLFVDGRAVTEEQIECGGLFVSAEQIECGLFTYLPATHATGVESFTYRVCDDGGTEFDGVDTSEGTATFSFNVRPVNDAPELLLSQTANYTFVVTTLEDDCDPCDGVLSLREALAMACDGDSITFDPALLESGDGTIVLQSTLTVDKQVYINGAIDGGRITLGRGECMDGPIVEVSECVSADSGGAVLRGLVLDGNCVETDSAALHNYGTLRLHDVRIEDQKTVADCGEDAVSAIFNAGCATLVASELQIKDNAATGGEGGYGDGGDAFAIMNLGRMTVDDVTVVGNSMTGGDGGEDSDGGNAYVLSNAGQYYQGSVSVANNSTCGGTAGATGCDCDSDPMDGTTGELIGCDPLATGFDLVFEAPVLTGQRPDVSVEFTVGKTPVLIAPGAELADVELGALREGAGNWSGARIEVKRVSGADASDIFGYTGESQSLMWEAESGRISKWVDGTWKVIASVSNAGGVLAIHFTGHGTAYATTEDVNYLLQHITYETETEQGDPVDLKVTVRDGNATYDGPQGDGGEGAVIGTVRVEVQARPLGVPGVELQSDSGCEDGVTNTLSFNVTLPSVQDGVYEGNVVRIYKGGEPAVLLFQSAALTAQDIENGYITVVPAEPVNGFDSTPIVARLAAGSADQRESAGSSPVFVTYDPQAPAAPVLDEHIIGDDGTLLLDEAGVYVISGSAEAFSTVKATIEFSGGDPATYTTTADGNGRFSVQVDAASSGTSNSEQAYSIVITASDRAGNQSDPVSRTYHVEERDPVAETAPANGGPQYLWYGAPQQGVDQAVIFTSPQQPQGTDFFLVHPDIYGTVVLNSSSAEYIVTQLTGDLRDEAEAQILLAKGSLSGGGDPFEDRPLYAISYWADDGFGGQLDEVKSIILQADAVQFTDGTVRLTADGVIAASVAGEGIELHGLYGNDRIVGGDGNDTLFGYDGDNILIGGLGGDILVSYGAPPSEPAEPPQDWAPAGDVLIGGDGDDTLVVFGDASTTNSAHLYGGCGADTFVVAPMQAYQAQRAGVMSADFDRDITIHDFVVGEDKIDLSWLSKPGTSGATALTIEDLNLQGLIEDLNDDGKMEIELDGFVSADGSSMTGTLTVHLAGGSTALTADSFILAVSTVDDDLLKQAQLYVIPG